MINSNGVTMDVFLKVESSKYILFSHATCRNLFYLMFDEMA